jgi:hypothetical protein
LRTASEIIDRDEKAHPVDLLETWKAQREANGQEALRNVSAVPVDEIDELLTTAFSAVQQQISDALARLEHADPESAELLRRLVSGLAEQRSGSGADVSRMDAVANRLEEIVRKLESRPKRLTIGWSN